MAVPTLIVMLTYNDLTVENAFEIFERCKASKARCWGFKEADLPPEEMRRLFAYMKKCGKTTALEVVAYNEAECLSGAEMAVDCGCDLLMGTMFFESVNELCKRHGLRYMPFVGKVSGRPSILDGTPEEMIAEAEHYLERGAYGIDLLGYRFTGDCADLNRRLVSSIDAPVCIAGSIDSFERLDEISEAAPWAYTIGSAFFDHRFGDGFREQIDAVCDYMEGKTCV